MKHFTPVLLSLTLFAGAAAPTWAQVNQGELLQYDAQELPTLPGYPYPRIRSVNNSGYAAGTNYTCPYILSCYSRSFLYDGEDLIDVSAQAIAAVPPGFVGLPYTMDLNNVDEVLMRMAVPDLGLYSYLVSGGATYLVNGDPDADPKAPGPLVPIPPPPGTVWAVNDSGTVVGSVELEAVPYAFLWEQGLGVIQLIAAPPGFSGISGRGLNNSGQVVGGVQGAAGSRGYLWVDGDFTILEPLPGHSGCGAYAVNDDGFVVGTSQGPNSVDSLVIWHDGQIVDSVTLEYQSGLLQYPECISASSQVVGYYWPTADSPQHFGFSWRQDSGFQTLNGTIENVPDLNIWAAEGVNDAGQIAAWGDYPDFTGGAFILTPILEVPGDLNGDGMVGIEDLLILLGTWGPCAGCPADLDGDGTVGVLDLLILLANWE